MEKKEIIWLSDWTDDLRVQSPPFLMDGFDEVDHHCLVTLCASSEIVFWFSSFPTGINMVQGNCILGCMAGISLDCISGSIWRKKSMV
ncbi:hypothetical protein CEXT_128221 [Caerostris extrusa]|uniref:Uncharacterized protein n=1 Tax=Caerostris extrusa TaxID=172846 RepID=A0AAV4PA87_CAEEX|nr:hypothetical protein CEXT_128221 [Caerostris extrusa]